MSDLAIMPASARQLENWDAFVDKSINGTLFHTRRFLAYHGKRFDERERWMVILRGESVVAQFVYAVGEDKDAALALSPYGGSYGGFVLAHQPSYGESKAMVSALLRHLADAGLRGCRITAPIACCSTVALDTFTFALLEQGFRSKNRDISSVVKLDMEAKTLAGSRARNMARKAAKCGITVQHNAPFDDYWVPMEATFARHATSPTHSRKQLQELCSRLPGDVVVDVAYLEGRPVGGVCYFRINRRVQSSFYFCQTSEGQENQSLSLLVMEGLQRALDDGYAWMDFGTSTLGMHARENIFRFKESFNSVGMFRETLEWGAS